MVLAEGNLLPVGTNKELKLKLGNLLAILDGNEPERTTSSRTASALRSSIHDLD